MKTIPHGVDSTATAIVIILCILALLLIVFQIIGIRRLRQSRRQMEAERRRIDEAKLHFFSSISYDLKTPMSMIISPLDRIIAENAGRPVAGQLKQVAGNARLLMDEIDRLLDFKHMKADASGFNPTYGDFAAFADVYLQRKRVRFFSEKGSGPQDGSKLIIKFKDHCLLHSFFPFRGPCKIVRSY